MKLGAAFLADAAMAIPDGTFMVWRGGISRTTVARFPATIKYSLVARLEAEPDEVVGQLLEFTIEGSHNGSAIAPTTRVPVAIPQNPGQARYYLNFIFDVVFLVQGPGDGVFQTSIAGVNLPLLHFQIMQGAPGVMGPPPPSPTPPTG